MDDREKFPRGQRRDTRPGYSSHRCNGEAIGDLPCARELLKGMIAQRAAKFALCSDAGIHFNAAKARVALRADGIVFSSCPAIAAAVAVDPTVELTSGPNQSR
jgi:hypothetical protein